MWSCVGWWCETGILSQAVVLWNIQMYMYMSHSYWFVQLVLVSHTLYFQGRSNVPPEKIPWNALCTLLSQCIYGGRIDNDFDQVASHRPTVVY